MKLDGRDGVLYQAGKADITRRLATDTPEKGRAAPETNSSTIACHLISKRWDDYQKLLMQTFARNTRYSPFIGHHFKYAT